MGSRLLRINPLACNYDGGKRSRLGGEWADVTVGSDVAPWTPPVPRGIGRQTTGAKIMSFSFYDAVVPSNLQILAAVDALLDKAAAFCAETGTAEDDIINARLAPDMLPFGYQIKSCAGHSMGAIDGTRNGSYSPDMNPWPSDFAGLHAALQEAIASLKAIDRDTFDALAESDTQFAFGETRMPFTGANFLLSFSQPNFYFHASIAYAILRAQGVKLGKRDFMGMPRLKR
jgi:hypothetical protein